jgi:hypothetical protein
MNTALHESWGWAAAIRNIIQVAILCNQLPTIYCLLNLDCTIAITQNFCRSRCVFNVAWSKYSVPRLRNEVTKKAIVQYAERLLRVLCLHCPASYIDYDCHQ